MAKLSAHILNGLVFAGDQAFRRHSGNSSRISLIQCTLERYMLVDITTGVLPRQNEKWSVTRSSDDIAPVIRFLEGGTAPWMARAVLF